jgi:hypothetical protein
MKGFLGIGLRALCAAPLSALIACTTAQMVVPPEVSKGSDVVAAEDRSSMSGALADESFKLGKLAIDDVDRDWDSGSSAGVLGFSSDRTEGGYQYKVKGDGADLTGGCVTEKRDKSMSLGSGMSIGTTFAKLGCTCFGGEGEPTKVVVSANNDNEYAGEVTTNTGTYQIKALYEAEGMISNGQPTGYRIDGEAGSRGAVEVLKPGRVWFAKDIEGVERHELACLYVGLMLYMPPDATD